MSNNETFRPVTWRQALVMCEDIESRRRLGKWEKAVVNKAYEMALAKKDLTPLLSERIEVICYGRSAASKLLGT